MLYVLFNKWNLADNYQNKWQQTYPWIYLINITINIGDWDYHSFCIQCEAHCVSKFIFDTFLISKYLD